MLHLDTVLHDDKASLQVFTVPLDLLDALSGQRGSALILESMATSLLPYVYLFAFLLPQFAAVEQSQQASAKKLWDQALASSSEATKRDVITLVQQLLRELLVDTSSRAT